MTASTDEAAALLSRLVACPSVNPQRRPPADATQGEGAMARLLAEIVGPWGGSMTIDEFAPGRCNFVARFGPARAARTLLLEAHADTVAAEGMTVPPFEPEVRDGCLFGRGSADTKASLAAMLLAVRTILNEGGPACGLVLAATGDEEVGGAGARRLMAAEPRPDAAIVGEPTDLAVVYATRGGYRCRIVTRGRAAHSSTPQRGTSAIRHMARVIETIEGPLAAALAARRDPVLGPPTVSVGTIRGGTQVNVVPDRCEIEVDRRTLPGETQAEVRCEMRASLDALMLEIPGLAAEIEDLEWYPALPGRADSPLCRAVAEAAAAVLGEARAAAKPWASNAGIFAEAGAASVVFGPGSDAQAHTAAEHVPLAQVAQAAAVFAEIIRRF
jgi:acetylornithine deacetylase